MSMAADKGEADTVIPATTDERIVEMVRRDRNLTDRGLVTERDVIANQITQIWAMAAEDEMVRQAAAGIDAEIAQLFEGAA